MTKIKDFNNYMTKIKDFDNYMTKIKVSTILLVFIINYNTKYQQFF